MQLQRYSDFSLGLHHEVAGRRIPGNGTIELTHRCSLRCVHCYNNLRMADQEAANKELSPEQHRRILDEIAEAGCLWLLYTGGEVLVRKDFLDIYTSAKQKGFLITLFTNGVLLDERIADYLAEWRPFSIEITLYGRTRETYERITGVPGSYDRCMRAIRLLVDRGLPLKLKALVMKNNKGEIWAMKRFAEEELGLSFRFDAMINPRIDCSKRPLAVRLAPEEVVELDLRDPQRMSEWASLWARLADSRPSHDVEGCLYSCGGGTCGFAIDPYGLLSPCILSRGDTWDLKNASFQRGWEGFLLDITQRKATKISKCTSCALKAMCGMCPANGELENGDPEEPVDFLCEVAHQRTYALGFSVPAHGECEYCEGGRRHGEMMQSLRAVRGGSR